MLTAAPKRIAPPTRLLYGPGPSMVEPRAYQAMSQPIVGIFDPYFFDLVEEIRAGLRQAFGTANQMTFTVPASGSGATEAAVANFVLPESKFVVFAAGHFADRMTIMAQRQRANVVRFEKPWGQVFSSEEAEEFLMRERPNAVGFVQAETSTGAFQSGRAITAAARQTGALVIADCVASLGAMPVEMDAVGIDVAFSCSQKGLSCPAGLSPISISPRAWEWLERRPGDPFTWYLDLRLMARYFEPTHAYQHTPSPPLYYAMHQALAAIEEEGLRNRWNRHQKANERLVEGLSRLGFELLVRNPADRIWHLTTAVPPKGVDETQVRRNLVQKYNIEVAGGIGQLAGKILRIGTMGPLATEENVDFLLEALAASM
ncbi:MAG: aminotransferase class V-fold PLP-dependent enzyme [Acidobacteriaceae bacterium]|nr:aminotransferase class V-fold PLP-dependent enzyme [Acidobacteriaceae bacterium]MBV9780484.1 aminotransferase class V-fold PLP-dependent enzyme [Acidobacteriaceae bacterium]